MSTESQGWQATAVAENMAARAQAGMQRVEASLKAGLGVKARLRHAFACAPSNVAQRIGGIAVAMCALSHAAPTLGPVQISRSSVPVCERLELTFNVSAEFDNPFDPRQIAVDAHFLGPDEKRVTFPAFLYQPHFRALEGKRETVRAQGDPVWKVRFATASPGAWTCRISARDAGGGATSPELRFQVTGADHSGYIHLRKGDRYFSRDDGSALMLIGENLAWASQSGTYDFDRWLPAAGKAGLNCARIWLQWNSILSIEHKASGCGRYDLANAWRMDYVLDLARESGVHVFFTLDSPEPYQKEHYWLGKLTRRPWLDCPHNVANGGPLREPREFYTSPEARRLIRQRLRYIVARWGWDPNICCWELWNELNVFPDWYSLVPETAEWHTEMIKELRRLDPYDRAISTSFCNPYGHEDIWSVPELDFVQSHTYGVAAMGRDYLELARTMMSRYDRPHVIGEFGPACKVLQQLPKSDPTGEHIHDAIWTTAMSGGPCTALSWCWDFYIHRCDLYRVFTPLARFCVGVPWNAVKLVPVVPRVLWAGPRPESEPIDLVIACGKTGLSRPEGTISVPADKQHVEFGRTYLYGEAQSEKQKPIVFEVDYAKPGQFIFRVGRVWQHGSLEVSLDGNAILTKEFPAGPGNGPWQTSEFHEKWKIWGADYNQDIALDIPAGKHSLRFYNRGKDGITIDRVTLTEYLRDLPPDLVCSAVAGRGLALVWIQNGARTWDNLAQKRELVPVRDAALVFAGVPAGPCRVTWWNTYAGQELRTENVMATKDGLRLILPVVKKDVACRITW